MKLTKGYAYSTKELMINGKIISKGNGKNYLYYTLLHTGERKIYDLVRFGEQYMLYFLGIMKRGTSAATTSDS